MAETDGGAGLPTPAPEEVAKVAGFGPAPRSFLGAPGYALAVRKRQAVLTAKVAGLNELLRKAEAERDGAEAQLGQAAVDYGLVTGDEAEALKSKVAEAERSISGAKERKTQADEQYERDMQRLGAAIAQVAAELEPSEGRRAGLEAEVKEAEAAQGRIEARLKRLEIELRSIEQAEAKGGMDGQTALARKAAAEGQKIGLEAEARAAAATLGRARAEANQLKVQLAPLTRKLAALEKEREDLTREHEERVGAHSEHQKRASNWRRSRLAIIGRQVHAMSPRPKLLDAERLFGRIEQSRDRVVKAQRDVELHLAAMDAFDHEATDRAKYVLMGAGGVLAVLLLALLLYSC